ncbi:MAG: type IV pilus assembly protein PilM [Planctomycetes bacterium]|nr:type IV pilus assembly protein PilM [Planctomycetota bacterium]
MAFHTIWSIDVGKAALKAVKLRRERNNVEILAIDKVDYPVSENGVETAEQAKEALSVFRTRNQVKEPVVVAHPGQGTFSRFIKVPAFDQKKVRDMVRYEASQQIPFPLDEVIWDYHVVNKEYLPGEEREVGLFAVRRETIDDYLVDFTREGLSVEMLTIGYLGLLNFIKFDINPPEPSIVLDIGAAHTDLVLVDGPRFWIRPLPHSGNDVTKAIMSRFKLAFAEAEKLKLETGKAPQQAEKIFKAVIQPKLQDLVQEVQRSLGYYRSQVGGDVKFTKVYLLGNGSRVVGIKQFLQDHLGIPVERVHTIGRLRVNREVDVKLLQAELAAFGTALGIGIQAVGVGACQVDLVPREEKLRKEAVRKRKHVFFAAAIIVAAMAGASGMIRGKLAQLQTALQTARDDTPPLYERECRELERATNVQLLSVIEELKGLGELRQGALEGLRSLERVLGEVSKKTPPRSAVAVANDKPEIEKVRAERLAALRDQVWAPYLKIERVDYPEDAAAKRGSGARARAAASETPTVPAYKFSLYAVVKEGENAQASEDAVKSLLRAPLEQDLVNRRWTKKPQVTARPGTGGHKVVFHVPQGPGGGGGGGQSVQAPEVEQEGQPFFGSLLEWYMMPRDPPSPAQAEAAGKVGKKTGKGTEDTEQPDEDTKSP